ncbi:carboxypeptidase [Myxococcota bacterium]|nr:carboxypeptidase [Myxococcota bacterium]
MRKLVLALLIAPLLATGFSIAASAQDSKETGSGLVRVYFPDREIRNKVLISFEAALLLTNDEEGYHLLEADSEDVVRLKAAGLRVDAEKGPGPPSPRLPGFPCYETVEETRIEAEAIVASAPDMASLIDVGDSWEKDNGLGGYDLHVLKLTNQSIGGAKPKLFMTCGLHAREYTTSPLCLDFSNHLIDRYGVDADVTWILDHHEVHLLMQANPDGRKQAEAGLYWRKNTNQNYCSPGSQNRGADLNRNFPFGWGCCGGSSSNQCASDYRGSAPESEPETQAVVGYMRSIFPDQRGSAASDAAPDDATGVYIDVHSYGELVLWPWGYTVNSAPNGAALQTLGRKLAHANQYWPGQAIGLYPTSGATDDFGYGDLGIASYTFELGTTFFQQCDVYEDTILPDNLNALLYAAKVSRTPYQTPSGPDVTLLSLESVAVARGVPVGLSATLDDTRFNNVNGLEPVQAISAAEYYVDIPPWSAGIGMPLSADDGAFDTSVEAVQGTLGTGELSVGRHIIFVRGRDEAGSWGATSAVFLQVDPPIGVWVSPWWGRVLFVFAVLALGIGRLSSPGSLLGKTRF